MVVGTRSPGFTGGTQGVSHSVLRAGKIVL